MAKNTAQAPLTPAVVHILLALSTGERHAYGIMKQVEADSQARAGGAGSRAEAVSRRGGGGGRTFGAWPLN